MEDLDGRVAQANRDLAASQERCRELEAELARCKAALGACDRAAELIERAACRDRYKRDREQCRICDVGRGLRTIWRETEPEGEWRA